MKIKLHHLLFTLVLAILTPAGIHSMQAQDASYPVLDSDDAEIDKERDRVMYSPGENDPLLNNKVQISVAKDSIASKPGTVRVIKTQAEAPKNSAKPASQEDDSILSFNFLNYLFEKYKLQDIVD